MMVMNVWFVTTISLERHRPTIPAPLRRLRMASHAEVVAD
jgi:hypothetical protein